jgi:anti-sigma regulatory factor (Ser/Thr protein kinase)
VRWVPTVHERRRGEYGVIDEHPGPLALEHRWSLPATPAASGHARVRLAPILQAWGLTAPQRDDALLVMNELVANAVEHARTPLVLTASFIGDSVLIEVADESDAAPQVQVPDRAALRGRGLQFVDSLARRWGWRTHTGGKTVWAEVSADGTEE